MFINIEIVVVIIIFIIIFIIHMGNNINMLVDIVEKQTKSLTLLNDRLNNHKQHINYIVESTKPIIKYIYMYGTDKDIKDLKQALQRWGDE